MGLNKIATSSNDQAIAAWVDYLNKLRLSDLLGSISKQDLNLENALGEVEWARKTISNEIVAKNLGGFNGMHGFIAEVAETGISNAQAKIVGAEGIVKWINDNGSIDLRRGTVGIQQKFYASGGPFSLKAIDGHLKKYPDFLSKGNRYQIPKDQYETLQKLVQMSEHEASRLTSQQDGPSYKNWKQVKEFFKDSDISFEDIEPSKLKYSEAKRDTYEQRLTEEKQSLKDTDQALRKKAFEKSKPSMVEGAKVARTAAITEGLTTLVLAIRGKQKSGKQLAEFNSEDWSEISVTTGMGAVKGGARGISIYGLTNYIAAPAAVASSVVTASFGVAEQANQFRKGNITELEFIQNAETACLDATVSALSAMIGQAIIPVPVLGALIGNSAGILLYQVACTSLNERETQIVAQHLAELETIKKRLSAEHIQLLERVEKSYLDYLDLLEVAFSPDIATALAGSVRLAKSLGVSEEQILDSDEKIKDYFLN